MKRKASTIVAALLVLGVLSMAVLPVYADPWDEEFGELKEISGEVSFKRPGGYFLTTDSGEEYKLVMGPPWHLDNLGLELKKGDKLTVKGYEQRSIILVTSVIKGKDEYEVATAEDLTRFHCFGPGPGPRGMMHGRGYGPHMGWRGDRQGYGPDWGWRGRGPSW